ncbi:HEPN domain-containing protein [Spirochaetia bacterium]|nr:HEPN domain-containing protein [Spirochaetia bacterium]GHT49005.1 HEPN domain-containing protein [Spirochaetia bacterium]
MEIETIREWFYLADADIDSAKLVKEVRPQHLEIICYHCEQAVEKYLKGFLQANEIMPPHIHDLEKLCAMCSEKDIRFDTIIKECIYLTDFATQLRYPQEIHITEYNVTKALADAETVCHLEPLLELRSKLIEAQTGSRSVKSNWI